MNELIKITYNNDRPAVSARDLHDFLEVKTAYKDWFPRMCEYGFTEGEDFCSFLSESTGGRPAQDAVLTIDMAKELCMIQRNEKGKQARQYFLQIEKDWNSPEKVMARALQIAGDKLKRHWTARRNAHDGGRNACIGQAGADTGGYRAGTRAEALFDQHCGERPPRTARISGQPHRNDHGHPAAFVLEISWI